MIAGSVASSVKSITTVERMQQTSACSKFSRIGSTSGAKISTNVICTANIRAQPSSKRSPIWMPVTPAQLRKYNPATASATLIGIITEGFRFKKIPMTGTITIYIAVRNPAFPASVSTSASCCRLQARNSGKPHRRPAFKSFLSSHRLKKLLPSFLNRSAMRITGSKASTAKKHRTAWKVNGPM